MRFRAGLAGLFALVTLAPTAGWSGNAVYRYVDARGVHHFTDAPVDTRYQRNDPVRLEGLAIAPPRRVKVPTERDYDHLILQVASQHEVEPGLVKAVIAAESGFRPHAVSRVGAQGLMQLMPATAADLGVERPFGVVENIDGGVRYLRAMLDRFGDVARALAAYNAGPGAVERHRGVPPYPETRAYIKRVLEYHRRYQADFERLAARSGSASGDSVRVADRSEAAGRAPGAVPLASRVGP
ncbi:MAG: lytic transglycosylase domain-containing protein [Myxococcota bacterium]